MPMYGAIEAGGTKIICMVAESINNVVERCQIPTSSPESTFPKIHTFFKKYVDKGLQDIGLACFGPLELDRRSANYGMITSTPKPGWQNINLKTKLEQALTVEVAIDTDVNAAGLGEYVWGAAKDVPAFIYVTIGTGIGGGAILNGIPYLGISHPEMGHLYVPHDKSRDPFPGICPYHGNCFEGLASGPALNDRWGPNFADLPKNHVAWMLESEYISYALVAYICIFAPQQIILGGGVMQQKQLLPLIKLKVKELLNNYLSNSALYNLDKFIVPPKLGNDSGIFGALALAMNLRSDSEKTF